MLATAVSVKAHAQETEVGEGDGERASGQREDEIIVYGRALKQIGVAITGSQGTVGYADFENLPISRTGELVENVPGVIATQHSGTGKANQYFLRGFNLDHGTDFAGFVDGVPVNMPTHGHGQGYLDFNFLIPETVERIDFRKGPYFADVGDFSAAGTVVFKTYDALRPFAQATLGEFGYFRATAGGSMKAGAGTILLAADATRSNGPWILDENLEKYNGLAKYSSGTEEDGFSVQLNGYRARWDSTDQIPERAVRSGDVGRFGFVDDDLGGRTTRIGAVANAAFDGFKINAFATYYDLRLTSNFTYFLDDPVNGDEFQQADRRGVFGGSLTKNWDRSIGTMPVAFKVGGNIRYDMIDRVGLFRSVAATPIRTVR
ncbi:MAG TPA: TonB-dependent receptor, partial [Sphingorhabdus sp.]|nr:TonB-dependent receptor [Sphingorhabdus sp.]